jgi:unsaturated rhamnogalacturonyl hydrolase
LTDCAFNGVAEGNVVRGATDVVLTNVTLNGQRVETAAPATAVTRPWSQRMVESAIARNPDPLTVDTHDRARWNYTQGLQFHAILEAWRRTGEAKYFDYVKRYYDAMISPDGSIQGYRVEEFNIDRVNGGRPLFALYQATKDEKYRKALDLLRSQMSRHPRVSDGGFWHKQVYPHQMWLDGLYMGSPFLAQYGQMFGEAAAGDDAALQCVLMEKHTRDPGTGLLYHGWDESRQQRWCDPATGLSKQFWGRAVGWYAMALVDVLDSLPENHPRRAEIIAEVNRLAEAIVRVKDPFDEVWYQVLDQPTRQGNYQESSASTMFVYALLKGVRKGYLDKKYLPIARKAYEGVIGRFIEVDAQGQVNIHKACTVAGLGGDPYRDGSYEYYVSTAVGSNDPKAVGPFILASLEFEALAR